MRVFCVKALSVGFTAIVLMFGPTNLIHAGNLAVNNGSFTNFTGGNSGAPSQLAYSGHTGTGYTTLTDWTVTGGTYGFLMGSGSADTTGSYSPQFGNNFYLWGPGSGGGGVSNGLTASSPDGGNYLALDAASSYRGGGISQSITGLTANSYYTVTFDWAGAQQHGFDGTTTEQVQVSLGSDVQSTVVLTNASHGFTGWRQQSFTFKADAATDVLNFLAIGTPDGVPPFVLLDGVSLSAAPVPEPGTLALSALGIIALVAIRSRRRGKTTVVA
ncbi:MAG: PEP-CTERM sorting domain-containing protein [Schlesneria sp.]